MAWRNAYSLDTLIGQLNASYPGWLFLGTKGDSAHQAVASDHNPNSAGVVTALDIGLGGGLKIHELADRLASSPQPDLKYIISNKRIAEWQNGFKWRAYNGSDPHDTHIHVSVGRGADGQSVQPYDDKVNWNIKGEDMSDLTNEDMNNLLKDFGITPTQADYNVTKGNNKDLFYYLQKRLKHVLVDGDVNNLLRDAGVEPVEADYQAVRKMNPKDFAYYLQGRLKSSMQTGLYTPVTEQLYKKK